MTLPWPVVTFTTAGLLVVGYVFGAARMTDWQNDRYEFFVGENRRIAANLRHLFLLLDLTYPEAIDVDQEPKPSRWDKAMTWIADRFWPAKVATGPIVRWAPGAELLTTNAISSELVVEPEPIAAEAVVACSCPDPRLTLGEDADVRYPVEFDDDCAVHGNPEPDTGPDTVEIPVQPQTEPMPLAAGIATATTAQWDEADAQYRAQRDAMYEEMLAEIRAEK